MSRPSSSSFPKDFRTFLQFGNNDLTIAVKRGIAPSVSGNTGGQYGKAKWYTVSDDPVKKRKK